MTTINSPEQIVQAHQYLYYVLCTPVISDYEYDMFCQKHGIPGNGGSDLAASYPAHIRAIPQNLLKKQ